MPVGECTTTGLTLLALAFHSLNWVFQWFCLFSSGISPNLDVAVKVFLNSWLLLFNEYHDLFCCCKVYINMPPVSHWYSACDLHRNVETYSKWTPTERKSRECCEKIEDSCEVGSKECSNCFETTVCICMPLVTSMKTNGEQKVRCCCLKYSETLMAVQWV